MTEFKVGDKVWIKNDLILGKRYGDVMVVMSMMEYLGKTAIITCVIGCSPKTEYMLDVDGEEHYWTDEMLEPVEVETVKEDEKPEMVNHPQHYAFKYEPIDVINDWGLDFNLGNTVKYIARCERKGNKIQDLEKAKFYLDDEIRRLKKNGIK